MRYTSTRDRSIDVSFETALISGYAPDGGLFVPVELPRLVTYSNKEEDCFLQEYAHLSYPELMQTILRRFIDPVEVSDEELVEVCQLALQGFDDPEHAVPIVKFEEDSSSSCFCLAELFHGPTFCFKDLGMRAVIALLGLFAKRRKQCITLIVSTTGDTGPAALQAVVDVAPDNPYLKIVVHYPHNQISDFQKRQLLIHNNMNNAQNVRVVAFEGGGDDMDKPIKNMLVSQKMESNSSNNHCHSIWTGVNSYNIGRPITQIVHYVWTYIRVAEQHQQQQQRQKQKSTKNLIIDLIVPTGAMGNVVAGYMSKLMGLPIRKFITATNINDITHRVVQNGAFHRAPNMEKTLSEAINIQVPYNFERLLYYITDGDDVKIRDYYVRGMEPHGQFDLDASTLAKLQLHFSSARVIDKDMCHATFWMYRTHNRYLVDPHTAVAVSAALQLGYLKESTDTQNAIICCILATASPCKFQDAVVTAVGKEAWDAYCVSSNFPVEARKILELPEQEPILYPKSDDFEATQLDWEQRTRKLVADLEGVNH